MDCFICGRPFAIIVSWRQSRQYENNSNERNCRMLAIAVNWTLIIHYLIVYDMHDILLDNQNIAYGLAKANCVVSLMAIIPEQQKNQMNRICFILRYIWLLLVGVLFLYPRSMNGNAEKSRFAERFVTFQLNSKAHKSSNYHNNKNTRLIKTGLRKSWQQHSIRRHRTDEYEWVRLCPLFITSNYSFRILKPTKIMVISFMSFTAVVVRFEVLVSD